MTNNPSEIPTEPFWIANYHQRRAFLYKVGDLLEAFNPAYYFHIDTKNQCIWFGYSRLYCGCLYLRWMSNGWWMDGQYWAGKDSVDRSVWYGPNRIIASDFRNTLSLFRRITGNFSPPPLFRFEINEL